jgi:hypothetical protein
MHYFLVSRVIFVRLILNNFSDNHFSFLVIEQKQQREKEKKKNKTCEYERELFQKLSKNGCTNIISVFCKNELVVHSSKT